jgi:hypothetical protein
VVSPAVTRPCALAAVALRVRCTVAQRAPPPSGQPRWLSTVTTAMLAAMRRASSRGVSKAWPPQVRKPPNGDGNGIKSSRITGRPIFYGNPTRRRASWITACVWTMDCRVSDTAFCSRSTIRLSSDRLSSEGSSSVFIPSSKRWPGLQGSRSAGAPLIAVPVRPRNRNRPTVAHHEACVGLRRSTAAGNGATLGTPMRPKALHHDAGERPLMGKAEKYRRFAEECMELARTAKDAHAKAALLHMAQVWLRLAINQATETETQDAS